MSENNQTAAPVKPQPAWAVAIKNEVSGSKRLREKEVAEAEFIKKTPRAAFFDLGKFGIGAVSGLELSNAKEILKNLKPGDKISARIELLEDDNGYIELSLTKAGRQKNWEQIQEFQESGEITKVKITGANSGGLTADLLGLKTFLPASQLSPENYPQNTEGDREKNLEELKKLVGKELNVKVISSNPRNQKIIISERETLGINTKELASQYQVGQIIDGIVSGSADFGIFVRFTDNPQLEGLVPISEIDYRIIDNPKEEVRINEPIKAKIIDIRDGKLSLSLKALKTDPWPTASEKHKAGEETDGKVYKFTPFGAVIDLGDGLQGLIHVSEFGGVEEMRSQLKLGQTYRFLVAAVKPEERRIILKAKKN